MSTAQIIESISNLQSLLLTSPGYRSSLSAFENYSYFKCIRCLALGSISHEFMAKTQLAYLLNLQIHLKIEKISLFDPIFDDTDKDVLINHYNLTIDETNPFEDPIIYFLPHIPLKLFESLISSIKAPSLLICNNIESHLRRFNTSEIIENYPNIGYLYFNQLEFDKNNNINTNSKDDDGFTIKTNRKNKNNKFKQIIEKQKVLKKEFLIKNKSNKNMIKCLYEFKNEEFQEFGNSFSDLFMIEYYKS